MPNTETPRPEPSLNRLWRADLDALQFAPPRHAGYCVVHRLVFRTLLGFTPTPADCLACFDRHDASFRRAALAKIAGRALPAAANFHLNSRDIRRA